MLAMHGSGDVKHSFLLIFWIYWISYVTAISQQNFVLFVPAVIYVEHENIISVRTFDPASEVHLSVSLYDADNVTIDEVTYPITALDPFNFGVDIAYKPTILPPAEESVNLKMTFTVRFCNDTQCSQTDDLVREENVYLAQRSILLFGEIEKPIYRPGETIRMRFFTLSPRVTAPLRRVANYPNRKLVKTGFRTYKIEDATAEDLSRSEYSNFDEILITDSENNVRKRWSHVSPAAAVSLNFTLLPDAVQGVWSIKASFKEKQENLRFTVTNYVLPRFTINIETPKSLSIRSKEAVFKVCAKYTNGSPLLGNARSILCVCDKVGQAGISQSAQEIMLNNRTCIDDNQIGNQWPCVEVHSQLNEKGCANFQASTTMLELKDQRRSHWNQHLIVCAEVLEQGTGVNITRCEEGGDLELKEIRMKFNFPSVYRPGLPFNGSIQVENFSPEDIGRAFITLHLSIHKSGCLGPFRYPKNPQQPSYLLSFKKRVEADGLVQFYVRPIPYNYTISLKAIYRRLETMELFDKEHSEMLVEQPNIKRLTDEDLFEAYYTIRPFIADSTTVVQAWPLQAILYPKCPGTVSLKLLANTPLSNKTIFVRSVVRGRHLERTIPPLENNDEHCRDQRGELGHYTCLQDGNIQCLDGWRGNDCLIPICHPDCHPIGGSCSVPGECVCNEGWSGDFCQECNKLSGCRNGQCVNGNDCVCSVGWQGYLCDQLEIINEYVPGRPVENKKPWTWESLLEFLKQINEKPVTTEAPKPEPQRTLYERDIDFIIDGDWGPKANVVIYFYDTSSGETAITPVTLIFDGMKNCMSSAGELQTKVEQNGLKFSTYHASPGQNIRMILSLQGLNESLSLVSTKSDTVLSNHTCFFRISDEAMSNFDDGTTALELDDFINSIHQVHLANGFYRPTEPQSVKQAFESAGIRVVMKYVTDRVFVECVPFLRNFGSPHTMVDGEPMQMRAADLYSSYPKLEIDQVPKPRLRDFFPEVWMFDVMDLDILNRNDGKWTVGIERNLTAPDSITTWHASAFCTTTWHGIWMPPSKQISVAMLFNIEIHVPKQVKRSEALYLPVSVYTDHSRKPNEDYCLDYQFRVIYDDADWVLIGSDQLHGCFCSKIKDTLLVGMFARRIGRLNVTIVAYGAYVRTDCLHFASNLPPTFSDKVRREISVVPEGIPKELTISSMLCLEPEQTTVQMLFPVMLPSEIVPDSLRTYVTFSDEVLGPAMHNLNQLIRLPVGCGEQNMLLVAPNVYVLDYLKSVPVINPGRTEKLIQDARSHIVSGYERQQKYKHDDGSYSAFGKADSSGSTWLTAFVLRVFAKAYEVDSTIPVNWGDVFETSVRFLNKQVDAEGCFVEKGTVIHSELQGEMGGSEKKFTKLLLTSYVLTTLYQLNDTTEFLQNTTLSKAKSRGAKCLQRLIETLDLRSLNTYALAQLSYAMVFSDPTGWVTQSLYKELISRQQSDVTTPGTLLFWTSSKKEVIMKQATAADIETTSYAYLTLRQLGSRITDLFSIIRWLSSQQTATGGFRSTQDTVLALQVIADGAKQLSTESSEESWKNDLVVSFRVEPNGTNMSQPVTDDMRRILNQFPVSSNVSDIINGFEWELSRKTNGSLKCLTVQNIMYYNIPEIAIQQNPDFAITYKTKQGFTYDGAPCTSASLTVCMRLGSNKTAHRDSNMILAQVYEISGWTAVREQLVSKLGDDIQLPKMVEFMDDGVVSVYFTGFTATEAEEKGGWDKLKRCFTIDFEQKMYVERANPGRIVISDYYDPHRSFEVSYSFDQCKSFWVKEKITSTTDDPLTTTDRVTKSTTRSFTSCPKCVVDKALNRTIVDYLLKTLCTQKSAIYLIYIVNHGFPVFRLNMTELHTNNYTSNWKAILANETFTVCPCASLEPKAKLVLISPEPRLIEPGLHEVTLAKMPPNSIMLSATYLLPKLQLAQERYLQERAKWKHENYEKQQECARIESLIRLINFKLLNND